MTDCQGRGSGRRAFSLQPQAPVDLGSSPSGMWTAELLSAPHPPCQDPVWRCCGPQCLTLGAQRTRSLETEIRQAWARPIPASQGRVGPKPVQEEEGQVRSPPGTPDGLPLHCSRPPAAATPHQAPQPFSSK